MARISRRAMNSPITYAVAGLACLGVIGSFLVQSVESVEKIKAPLQTTSPYREITTAESPGLTWAKEFVTRPMGSTWEVSQSTAPAQPYTYEECSGLGLPSDSVLNTVRADGGGYGVIVQLYSPGEAVAAYGDYKKKIGACWESETASHGSPNTEVSYSDRGFFFARGDALIFVDTPEGGSTTEFIGNTVGRASETLLESKCLSLVSGDEDRGRNLYTAGDGYTGMLVHDIVRTKVPLSDLPTLNIARTDDRPTMREPEGPLPEDFPELPRRPERPEIPSEESLRTPEFAKEIVFQGVDVNGPGCGWSWSSVGQPVVDANALTNKERQAYKSAQDAVDGDALKWVDDRLSSVGSLITLTARVDDWNRYVVAVGTVHERWRWLNDQRDKLERPWFTFKANHENWRTFDSRKAAAQRTFEAKTLECQQINDGVARWDETYGAGGTFWSTPEGQLYREQNGLGQSNAGFSVHPVRPVVHNGVFPASPVPPLPEPTQPGPTSGPSPLPSQLPSPEPSPEPIPTETTPTQPPVPRVVIPQRPRGCSGVERAAILDREKPAEPKPPVIPKGVTIPHSWR